MDCEAKTAEIVNFCSFRSIKPENGNFRVRVWKTWKSNNVIFGLETGIFKPAFVFSFQFKTLAFSGSSLETREIKYHFRVWGHSITTWT